MEDFVAPLGITQHKVASPSVCRPGGSTRCPGGRRASVDTALRFPLQRLSAGFEDWFGPGVSIRVCGR